MCLKLGSGSSHRDTHQNVKWACNPLLDIQLLIRLPASFSSTLSFLNPFNFFAVNFSGCQCMCKSISHELQYFYCLIWCRWQENWKETFSCRNTSNGFLFSSSSNIRFSFFFHRQPNQHFPHLTVRTYIFMFTHIYSCLFSRIYHTLC